MYLTKKTYVYGDERENLSLDGLRHPVKPERVINIEEEVLAWRKANYIHKWFVDNVQEGADDCKDYHVGREELIDLLEVIKKVSDGHSLAEELLPPEGGFFFGSTETDEWYFSELERTKAELEKLLTEEGGSFYYGSSW